MRMPVKKKIVNLLIADRNAHIREFLKREMTLEGYTVYLADNGDAVMKRIHTGEGIDLLIIDPEIPRCEELALMKRLGSLIPPLPIILHISPTSVDWLCDLPNGAAVVEKGGNSIEALKRAVKKVEFERTGI